MKKLLLGLGSVATIVAPIVVVVSCADEKPKVHIDNKQPTYATGHNHDSVQELIAAFKKTDSVHDYNAIMTAIGIGDGREGFFSGITFSLVGDVLTKSFATPHDGQPHIVKTVYTIAPAE